MSEQEKFCRDIGCSGIDKKCPGNPKCEIVIKVFGIPITVKALEKSE